MNLVNCFASIGLIVAVFFSCQLNRKSSNDGPDHKTESYSYDFDENGCKTGKKTFTTLESYCKGLLDDGFNNYCAKLSRATLYKQHCIDSENGGSGGNKPGNPGTESDNDTISSGKYYGFGRCVSNVANVLGANATSYKVSYFCTSLIEGNSASEVERALESAKTGRCRASFQVSGPLGQSCTAKPAVIGNEISTEKQDIQTFMTQRAGDCSTPKTTVSFSMGDLTCP